MTPARDDGGRLRDLPTDADKIAGSIARRDADDASSTAALARPGLASGHGPG